LTPYLPPCSLYMFDKSFDFRFGFPANY
jgi:hypothetical protein